MNFTPAKYSFILLSTLVLIISACSVDNKSIPNPGGNIGVDTTAGTGTFYMNVTGDTSFVLTVVAVDTIIQDSLGVIGADLTTKDEIIFTTGKAEPGIYYVEQSPPGITGAVFIFRKKVSSGYKIYPMLHGQIVISSIDFSTGIVTGSFDVNNKYVTTADRLYQMKANFVLKFNI
jgi:hypothetical protein